MIPPKTKHTQGVDQIVHQPWSREGKAVCLNGKNPPQMKVNNSCLLYILGAGCIQEEVMPTSTGPAVGTGTQGGPKKIKLIGDQYPQKRVDYIHWITIISKPFIGDVKKNTTQNTHFYRKYTL